MLTVKFDVDEQYQYGSGVYNLAVVKLPRISGQVELGSGEVEHMLHEVELKKRMQKGTKAGINEFTVHDNP